MLSHLQKTSPPNGDPTKPSKDDLVNKYGSYIKDRWNDYELLNHYPTDFSADTKTAFKDRFLDTAKRHNLDPNFLFSSASEEGFRNYIRYGDWTGDRKYPIDGFVSFGLDNFGDDFPMLAKAGYLPADFKDRFQVAKNKNEQKQQVNSANFKTIDDAIEAKAAYLKYHQDYVKKQAEKRGIQLTPKALNFFTGVSYNGGQGTMQKMLDDYNKAGYIKDDAFLKQRPTVGRNGVQLSDKSYAGVYDNVMRRIVPAQAWEDSGLFSEKKPPVEKAKPATPDSTGNSISEGYKAYQ